MESLTIREAAGLCGMSVPAMRKRVDRGTVGAVLRDGVRRIPRSELDRAGLVPGARVRELELELQRLQAEVATLRLLPERVEQALQARIETEERARVAAEQESFRAIAEAQIAATRLVDAQRQAENAKARVAALTEQQQALLSGSWLERRRARRSLQQSLPPLGSGAPQLS